MKEISGLEELEQRLGRVPMPIGAPTFPSTTVLYFTAGWCGACKRLDMVALEAQNPTIEWLKCDVDKTPDVMGYCQVRAIPSFVLLKGGRAIGPFQHNQNEAVAAWLRANL
jgi:thioredoxin-like negative regulator of GroEL